MNLDRLKKLVKLANNNPNENEANAAARLVCKMLDDYQFEGVKEEGPFKSAQYNDWVRRYTVYRYDWKTPNAPKEPNPEAQQKPEPDLKWEDYSFSQDDIERVINDFLKGMGYKR